MSLRFTDPAKWQSLWFSRLSPEAKLAEPVGDGLKKYVTTGGTA